MPHQCVRCNAFYDDGAEELLKGCPCGAKLFFFIKKERLEKAKQLSEKQAPPVSEDDARQVEQDIYNVLGVREEPETPVVLDLEAVRVKQPGKYELDIVHLFKGEPLIFKLADGKYIIDIAETFRRVNKKRGKNA